MLSQQEIISEYHKCLKDKTRIYMIENYLTTFDATKNNTVPYKLFPKQKEYLNNLSKHVENITTKPRQAGITTTTCAFFACEMALADPQKPENILLIANSLEMSKENLIKIKDFLEQLPRWFWGNEYFGTEEKEKKTIFKKANEKYLILYQNSKVYARSAGPDASRGVSSISRLLFDEAAFIETPGTITSAISTTAASAKSVIFVSTPNGSDLIYYPTYTKAKKGENSYKLTEFRWFQDPRYNKHLTWKRLDKETGDVDIIKEETIDELGSVEYNDEKWSKLLTDGYMPSSVWYDDMCSRYNHDKKKIAQELDVSFLGSAGTVVDIEIIRFHETANVCEPMYTDTYYQGAWIYKEPIEGHRYILCSDVATGSGDDSSVISIIDTDAVDENNVPFFEQVFEYQGKIQGDILGEIINKYGRYYGNALAVVDCIGSSGDLAVNKLQNLGYPQIYSDDPNLKNITVQNNYKTFESQEKKALGFRMSNVRHQMLSNLEKCLRFNEYRPRSKRFTSELNTWIWKNGREDHQKGFHDDTITAVAMGLFVLQFSYSKLANLKEKNKAILNGMVLVQNMLSNKTSLENNNDTEYRKKIPLPFYTSTSTIKQTQNNGLAVTNPIHRNYFF